jgi:hypothetical protein
VRKEGFVAEEGKAVIVCEVDVIEELVLPVLAIIAIDRWRGFKLWGLNFHFFWLAISLRFLLAYTLILSSRVPLSRVFSGIHTKVLKEFLEF